MKNRPRDTSSPYSKAKPSEVTDAYWLAAERKKGVYPIRKKLSELSLKDVLEKEIDEPDENGTVFIGDKRKSGKWLIFVPLREIDAVWEKIKIATEDGRLGDFAKVSTATPNSNATSSEKVICVYTYDWTDEKDVKRIREELRKLGVTNKIPYKSDKDTLEGKYAIKGDYKISKYYE